MLLRHKKQLCSHTKNFIVIQKALQTKTLFQRHTQNLYKHKKALEIYNFAL